MCTVVLLQANIPFLAWSFYQTRSCPDLGGEMLSSLPRKLA